MKKSSQNQKNGKGKVLLLIGLFIISILFGGSKIDWSELSIQDIETILSGVETILVENVDSAATETKENEKQTNQNKQEQIDLENANFEVFVFDVGQADAILVACEGEYLMIDAGNNEDGKLLANHLKSMGIKEFKYVIGTHAHEDHIGGTDDIINNFIVENLYMPDVEYNSATFKSVKSSAKKKKIDVVAPEVGHIFNIGDARCEIMAIDNENEDMNLTSIVVEITYGENKFLFMADAEIENEEKRLWNDIDVLKVGHHGSSTSSSDDFLEQTKPEVALISVGTGNTYGHPHKEVMEALNDYEMDIYRTDKQGTLHVISDGENYQINTLNIDLDGNKEN